MKLKTHLVLGVALAFIALTPEITPAQQRSITASEAQGLQGAIPTIAVWPGAGVSLNFIPTGEIIKKVWLDDPSKITLDFDGPMCVAAGSRGSDCGNSAATVVHLRRINGLKFPHLPQTETTLLTVITQGPAGRNLYQFQVVPGTGKPQYSTLVVKSDALETSSLGTSRTMPIEVTHIVRGLQVAVQRGQIRPDGPLSGRLKNFLVMARNGYALPAAAQKAGVSMAVINKLAQTGMALPSPSRQPVAEGQPQRPLPPAPNRQQPIPK